MPHLSILLCLALVGFAHGAEFRTLGTVPSTVTAVAPAPGGAHFLADRSSGKLDCGQILRLENRRKRPLFTFTGYNGKAPSALVRVRREVLGITTAGGKHGYGTLFRIRGGRRVQTLHHFDEVTGAPRSLDASGRHAHGVCSNGVFLLRGRTPQFHPLSVPGSRSALVRGSLYAAQNYLYDLYRLDPGEPVLVHDAFPAWLVGTKRSVLGINAYGGKYNSGLITEYLPGTGKTRTIAQFLPYNGGHPRAVVALRNGALYSANSEGIWRVGSRPKRVRKLSSVDTMTTDGRRLYGLAGSLDRVVFEMKP